jgi:hypothetical protein
MKPIRWREIGLVISGALIGFAFGMDTYLTFFLPPSSRRNGWGEFLVNGGGFVGLLLLTLIRAETRRKDDANEKHDA